MKSEGPGVTYLAMDAAGAPQRVTRQIVCFAILGGPMFIVPVSRPSHEVGRQLTRLFDDAFGRAFDNVFSPAGTDSVRNPALDVVESEHAYTLQLEMPGVAKEDIKVSIEGRQVSVQAQSPRADERSEGERVVYRERPATSYARSFTLPAEVDQTEAGARLEHGVLTLTLPKRGARSASHITVN